MLEDYFTSVFVSVPALVHGLFGNVVVQHPSLEEGRQLQMAAQFGLHYPLFAAMLLVLVIELVLAQVVWTGHGGYLWRRHITHHLSPNQRGRQSFRLECLSDLRGLNAELRHDYLLAVFGLPVEDLCSSDATLGHNVHIYRTSAARSSYVFPCIDVRDVGVIELLLDGDDSLQGSLIWVFVLDDCLANAQRYQDVLHLLRDLVRRDALRPRGLLRFR